MKIQHLFLFVGVIFLLGACSNKDKFVIKGEISNGKGKTLYLQKLGIDDVVNVDSVVLSSGGSYKFTLPRLGYPSFYLLKLSENNFITLLGDTTEHISVSADAKNLTETYTVKNSMGSSYVKTLNRKFDMTKDTLGVLLKKYNSIPNDDEEGRKDVRQKMLKVIDGQKDFIYDFIMTNPRSFASYYAVFQRYDNGELVLDVFKKKDQIMFSTVATSLQLLYPESPRVKQLTKFVLSARYQQKQAEMASKIKESAQSTIPEIKEPNLQGDTIKLSSLRGKTVLLSFWASWDQKSRIENERLLKIYNKYKNRNFTVYQVSLDKSKILWEEAVEVDRLPWINVSDLQYTNSYPARIYNVRQLPANYLISPQGEIIGKDLFGRILDDKLDEVLKN